MAGTNRGYLAPEWNASGLFNHTLPLRDIPYLPPTSPSSVSLNDTLQGNFSVELYLETYLGPPSRPLGEAVVLSIVYCLIFLTGLAGNVSTCIVITRNNYMHTATNYYLFSLAISDVLTLITGLPPELYSIWEAYPWAFGEPFCVMKIFLQETTSCASVLTITAFTLERYVAICHPLRAQAMSSLRRVIRIIIVIWCVAACTALPYPATSGTFFYLKHPYTDQPIADSLSCSIRPHMMHIMKYMFQVSTFILFIAPMSIITIIYIQIGLTLRRSGVGRRTTDKYNASPTSGPSPTRKAVLKMLVAVVVAFFICWAPFHAQRLMTAYVPDDKWTSTMMETQTVLFYISGVLYFVGSTVNPILYNLMSRKYRQAFRETLCRCCPNSQQDRSRLYSNTYSTVVQSRLTLDKGTGHTQLSRSPAIRRAFKFKTADINSSSTKPPRKPPTNRSSWKERLLMCPSTHNSSLNQGNGITVKKSKNKKDKKHPNTGKLCAIHAPNGNTYTSSKSSRSNLECPTLAHVQQLRDELELTDRLPIPDHDIIYTAGSNKQAGTQL